MRYFPKWAFPHYSAVALAKPSERIRRRRVRQALGLRRGWWCGRRRWRGGALRSSFLHADLKSVQMLEQAIQFGVAAVELCLISGPEIFGIFRDLAFRLYNAFFGIANGLSRLDDLFLRLLRREFGLIAGSEAGGQRLELGGSIFRGLIFLRKNVAVCGSSRFDEVFIGPDTNLMDRTLGILTGRRGQSLLLTLRRLRREQ